MATRVMCSCEEEEEDDDDDDEDDDDDDEEWVVDLSAEVGVEGSLPRERRGTIDGLHWDVAEEEEEEERMGLEVDVRPVRRAWEEEEEAE